MDTGPERSKPLHNFSLPCLKWGSQRLLRCVNADPPSNKRKNDDDIDVVRQQIMGDLRVAAKKLKVSIFQDGLQQQQQQQQPSSSSAAALNSMPWNLRTRRAACKAPSPPNQTHHQPQHQPSHVKEKKKVPERPKFSVSLSKQEVEQDFWTLLRTRPPRRPKRRPRNVQRQLNTLFPGLWLGEVTAETYKVSNVPE